MKPFLTDLLYYRTLFSFLKPDHPWLCFPDARILSPQMLSHSIFTHSDDITAKEPSQFYLTNPTKIMNVLRTYPLNFPTYADLADEPDYKEMLTDTCVELPKALAGEAASVPSRNIGAG